MPFKEQIQAPDFSAIKRGDMGSLTSAIITLWRFATRIDHDVVTRNGTQEIRNKSIFVSVVTKTADYTATDKDSIILCGADLGAFTITLPPAANVKGLRLDIKKIDSSANAVTIDGNASETIDGDLTISSVSEDENIPIVSDGSNWRVM